jgi:signal transduction histidine kinase
MVIFAAAAAVGAINLRRLGRTADANAAQAAKLAARLEREKYHFYVHNATGLLAHFGLDDIPPEILPALRHQALQESNRLRADFLADPANGPASPDDTPDDDPTLDEAVRASVAGFEHLPLAVRTALARGVRLPRDEALALQTAVVSLLYNVQFHAGPGVTEVVVHADAQGDSWEVSVCDDGKGFDPEVTRLGFGLGKQVIESARSKGMAVEVKSTPGEGTCVFIRGARRDSPSPANV